MEPATRIERATSHRFGPEPCLTDSYEGGQPPCTIPVQGAHPLQFPPARPFNGTIAARRHPTVQMIDVVLRMMEPATRIERATCGLRTSASPTSDNVSPQETINQNSSNMGGDGASLSCPGSSVVANSECEGARLENPPASATIGSERPSTA